MKINKTFLVILMGIVWIVPIMIIAAVFKNHYVLNFLSCVVWGACFGANAREVYEKYKK